MKKNIEKIIKEINEAMPVHAPEKTKKEIDDCIRKILEKNSEKVSKGATNNWKTIQKEITIYQGTLKDYGEYVDFVHLDDEKISIRLIVKQGDKNRTVNAVQLINFK